MGGGRGLFGAGQPITSILHILRILLQQGLEAGMVTEGVEEGIKLKEVDGEPGGGRKQIL